MVSPFLLPPELIPLPGTAPGKDVAQMLHLVSLIYTSVTEGGSVVGKKKKKKSTCSAGDQGWISGSRRSPGEGNGNPVQYSCLKNPMNRGAWYTGYSPWGCKELERT